MADRCVKGIDAVTQRLVFVLAARQEHHERVAPKGLRRREIVFKRPAPAHDLEGVSTFTKQELGFRDVS
jgi:hypothetical protein